MAIPWLAVENAIHDWVRANVPANVAIIEAEQDGPRPPNPYIAFRIDGPRRVGGFDEVRNITNLGNPLGQEIQQTSVGQRELTVSLQSFSDRTVVPGAPWATGTVYLLNAVVTNAGNVYRCTTPGTSTFALGGPTGTSSGIVDNNVLWAYVSAAITSREILGSVLSSLALPSQLDNLYNNGGLVLQDQGSVQNISIVIETKWEGRAALDVVFRLTDSVVENTGYVDGVIFGATGVGGTYTG
jgi:hypothetical protein